MRWGSGVWRADREMHLARPHELGGDLEAGVAAADDQHRARRQVGGRPVPAAVHLHHIAAQVGGHRRRERNLERPGGDHDLVGLIAHAVEEFDEAALRPPV